MTAKTRADLLVETDWLAAHLRDPDVRVIEMAQASDEFERAHIPGAVVSPTWQIKGALNPRLVAPPEEAKAWFESVGIGDGTLVVGYDRFHSRDAARLWWVLSYYGHENAKILNGGWTKWIKEGRETESGLPSMATDDVTFTPSNPQIEILSTVDELKKVIGRHDTVIWDVRADDEYSGDNGRGNARVGHIPGSVHLEWTHLVAEDDTFRSDEEIRAIVGAIGITPEIAVHTY